MGKKDLDKIVTVDKIVDTLMKDAEFHGYLEPPKNEMVYKVPPYNDELDTNEADDMYNIKNIIIIHNNTIIMQIT